jgi:hypothetical protein
MRESNPTRHGYIDLLIGRGSSSSSWRWIAEMAITSTRRSKIFIDIFILSVDKQKSTNNSASDCLHRDLVNCYGYNS